MNLWKLKLLSVGLLLVLWTNANPPEKTYAANISYQSTSSVASYVSSEAPKYGINPELALCIVKHESQFNPLKDGPDTGGTLSRGLWQWNDYWHPEISDKCSHDVECSTRKALKWIALGHVRQWSTYKLYCRSIQVYK